MTSRILLLLLSLFFALGLVLSCDTQPTQVENGNNGDNGEEPFSHTEGPGYSAEDFLLEDRFSELIVEVQYMPGYRPLDSSLDELRDFLEEHLNKTITILEPEEIESGGQDLYSASDVRALEEEHRRHFSEGNTLASYNLFVDGEFDQNQNVLGIAYYNTSNAYFGETIHRVTGSPPLNPSRRQIEGTVLRHEYGHLIGLVDNGVAMQEDHQENGPHCSENECIVYATVNTADFFANLFDDYIPNLDDFCRADIAAVREND